MLMWSWFQLSFHKCSWWTVEEQLLWLISQSTITCFFIGWLTLEWCNIFILLFGRTPHQGSLFVTHFIWKLNDCFCNMCLYVVSLCCNISEMFCSWFHLMRLSKNWTQAAYIQFLFIQSGLVSWMSPCSKTHP